MNEFAELREKLGWTCSKVALKVGRHQTTVFRWNVGVIECPLWAIEMMREWLDKKEKDVPVYLVNRRQLCPRYNWTERVLAGFIKTGRFPAMQIIKNKSMWNFDEVVEWVKDND